MAEPTAAVRAGTARQALAPEWPHLRRAAMLSVASGLLWLPLAGFAAMALAGGPRKISPAASQARAKAAFSARKP